MDGDRRWVAEPAGKCVEWIEHPRRISADPRREVGDLGGQAGRERIGLARQECRHRSPMDRRHLLRLVATQRHRRPQRSGDHGVAPGRFRRTVEELDGGIGPSSAQGEPRPDQAVPVAEGGATDRPVDRRLRQRLGALTVQTVRRPQRRQGVG